MNSSFEIFCQDYSQGKNGAALLAQQRIDPKYLAPTSTIG